MSNLLFLFLVFFSTVRMSEVQTQPCYNNCTSGIVCLGLISRFWLSLIARQWNLQHDGSVLQVPQWIHRRAVPVSPRHRSVRHAGRLRQQRVPGLRLLRDAQVVLTWLTRRVPDLDAVPYLRAV
jgi:hypothetical protein